MPYFQLTPHQKRGCVVLDTPLCGYRRHEDITYDRKNGRLLIEVGNGSQILQFIPNVRLRKLDAEIPCKTTTYVVELSLEHQSYGCGNTSDGCNQTSAVVKSSNVHLPGVKQADTSDKQHTILPDTSVSSRISDHSGCIISSGDSFCGLKDDCRPSTWVANFLGGTFECKSFTCPIVGHSEGPYEQSFTVSIRDLHISRHYLQDISVQTRDGLYTLIWSIVVYTPNIPYLDLRIATLRETACDFDIIKHRRLVVRCKRCQHILESVEDATILPLPTEFFSSVTGSTFCEECEPQLSSRVPSLVKVGHIIYQGEEVITLYRPSAHAIKEVVALCAQCGYRVGAYSDCDHQFVSYSKRSISAFVDDKPEDIFWRHTPEREAVETLQYHSGVKLFIFGAVEVPEQLSVGSTGPGVEEEHTAGNCCIELIKVTSQPDAFVATSDTVIEASRVLWRLVEVPEGVSLVRWSSELYDHLLDVLRYFSQSTDPATGFTPSLLVGI
ncbi:Thiamine pyrophosphate-dependent possible carboligase or decarboxylase, putative [Babesia ovata]|uniref:Thiamine pyrophosphate-dependent possible carboligase or decarboxylase, putative n=1 Tax=Babesia ovata TaxID=189622 RepID=A0A2H6KHN6_9APIC|nr:Thiamine pyrophosphate-dependent possible carboligase or decarboxylase, putative [Babesia ovata]GBE62491.1 Thiamine pyrophosphate-dependent possible carboligase or decarboxylase, putative [Babesia ovata]